MCAESVAYVAPERCVGGMCEVLFERSVVAQIGQKLCCITIHNSHCLCDSAHISDYKYPPSISLPLLSLPPAICTERLLHISPAGTTTVFLCHSVTWSPFLEPQARCPCGAVDDQNTPNTKIVPKPFWNEDSCRISRTLWFPSLNLIEREWNGEIVTEGWGTCVGLSAPDQPVTDSLLASTAECGTDDKNERAENEERQTKNKQEGQMFQGISNYRTESDPSKLFRHRTLDIQPMFGCREKEGC
ncbi:hypothetical protein V1508DRAFT_288020 [Lipomyces doorenjongii]|uniref:uncharacterized protein n=1 Tax=Lipomyces doorenjongii TaxID=383834 RepID=UPI0034CE4FA6